MWIGRRGGCCCVGSFDEVDGERGVSVLGFQKCWRWLSIWMRIGNFGHCIAWSREFVLVPHGGYNSLSTVRDRLLITIDR